MKSAASCGLGFFHWIVRQEVGNSGNETRGSQSILNVVALEINIGIDFVGDAVVALVTFESGVVSSGADPSRSTFHPERRLPHGPMIPRSDDPQRLGVLPGA